MQPSARASGYDLFKSIVAFILLILFLLLNRSPTPQSPTPVPTLRAQMTATPAPLPSLTETSHSARTVTPLTSPTESAAITTPTLLPSPTNTNIPEPTAPPQPTGTPTLLSSPTITKTPGPTTTPLPTATLVIESTSPPVSESTAVSACETAGTRSHLRTGMTAILLRRLNFRSSPGIGDNWLRTNLPGTKVEIVGGPECIPHLTGAYIWWQVKLPDGQIGWSAEVSRFGSFYFMEPAK